MKESGEKETLRYVKIFVLIVVIAAIVSFAYKVVTLVANSSFKNGSFNAVIVGKNVWLIHIDPSKNQIVSTELVGARKLLANKSTISQSAILGVLVDGEVTMGSDESYGSPADFFIKPRLSFRNINDFDTAKMIYYTKIIPRARQIQKQVVPGSAIPLLGKGDYLLKTFGDEKLLTEGKSIEIINSSEINGFGSKAASAFKSIGLNVVKIDSADNKKSAILTSDPDLVIVKRVANALKIPVRSQNAGSVADITIVIGKDLLVGNNPISK